MITSRSPQHPDDIVISVGDATDVDFALPFGGAKDSSLGPGGRGKAAQQIRTSTRTVAVVA